MNLEDTPPHFDPLGEDDSNPAGTNEQAATAPGASPIDVAPSLESGSVGPPAPPASSLPEDIRVPWGWLDLLIFVLAAFAGIFLLMVLTVIAIAAFGGNIEHLRESMADQAFISVVVQAILDVALLGYLAAYLRLRFRLPFWRGIGWRPLPPGKLPSALAYLGLVSFGCLLALAVAASSSLFPPKGELPVQQLFQYPSTAMLFAMMSVAIAPVVEETVFRGFLYPVAARSFGIPAGIVVTGTLFGLLHAVQLMGGWWQIALLVVVGIVFTLVRALTRTVAASFTLHFSYNALQVIALAIDTHGFRQMNLLH